jgi:hypothetical protein
MTATPASNVAQHNSLVLWRSARSPQRTDHRPIRLGVVKVFLEGDERYRKFLTAPKPSIKMSKFATNVK